MLFLAGLLALHRYDVRRLTKVPIDRERHNPIAVRRSHCRGMIQITEAADLTIAVTIVHLEDADALERGMRIGACGALDYEAAQVGHAAAVGVRARAAPGELNAGRRRGGAEIGDRLRQ